MRNWTSRWASSVLVAGMLAVVIPLPYAAQAETGVQTMQKNIYENQYQAIEEALEAFKRQTTADNLRMAIDALLKLPNLSEYPNVGDQDDKDVFTDEIIRYIPFITNKEGEDSQSEIRIYFAKEAIKLVERTNTPYDYTVANKTIENLPPGNERMELATRLEEVKGKVFHGNSDYIDWNNPPANIKVDPYTPSTNAYTADYPGDDYFKSGVGETPAETEYERTNIEYRAMGSKCYKILEHYKGGRLVITEKKLPDKLEQVFCEVTESSIREVGTRAKSPKGTFTGFDPYNKKTKDKLQQESIKHRIDQITVQYTFEKSSESPYFYDTGIAIAENKTVTYAQAKDALHMISVQAKGKFVEDKGKALALINGKIILVTDSGKAMPFAEFASMFSETKVGVRALDTRSGEQVEMADLVEIKGISSVFVKGKEIKFVSKPIVDNSIVLLPIEQIAKALGGTVTKNEKTISIKAKNQTLVYEDGSTTILLNEKKVDAHVPVRVNKDGVMMAPIHVLVDAFGMTVGVEESKVVIK